MGFPIIFMLSPHMDHALCMERLGEQIGLFAFWLPLLIFQIMVVSEMIYQEGKKEKWRFDIDLRKCLRVMWNVSKVLLAIPAIILPIKFMQSFYMDRTLYMITQLDLFTYWLPLLILGIAVFSNSLYRIAKELEGKEREEVNE